LANNNPNNVPVITTIIPAAIVTIIDNFIGSQNVVSIG